MSKRFIYGILFNFPRAILDILDSAITVVTLGYYTDLFRMWKIFEHSKWASEITNKYGYEN